MDSHRQLTRGWPANGESVMPLFIGTGRCGGCFDAYGMQHHVRDGHKPVTELSHADVWHRGRHGLDTQLPWVAMKWSQLLDEPMAYEQQMDYAHGRMRTHFAVEGFEYSLATGCSPAQADRDVLRFDLNWTGEAPPDWQVAVIENFMSNYNGCMVAEWSWQHDGEQSLLDLRRGNSHGYACLRVLGDATIEKGDARQCNLRLKSGVGRATVIIGMGHPQRRDEITQAVQRIGAMDEHSWQDHANAAWDVRWGPDFQAPSSLPDEWASLYQRSHYHLLASYAPDVRCPAPPHGFTGNGWGFHFPQDLGFIHPALLAHGHVDITRAHLEFYHSRLENQRELTRSIYQREGVCWSWEFPIGDNAQLFREDEGGAPNDYQFEIHNAACPAKMAYDTALAMHDANWTREIAWPIVLESSRFFASCLIVEADGCYSLQVAPSMGQDEFGGKNAKNYLCALHATEFTLRAAIDLAAQLGISNNETAKFQQILKAGMAWDRLRIADHPFFAANESLPFEAGRQKHPVQLNPLWMLPMASQTPRAETIAGYHHRRVICGGSLDISGRPSEISTQYHGWTLLAYLLSAARMEDRDGFLHEMSELHASRMIDAEAITFYESSGEIQPYYTTAMGLWMQAMRLGHSWFL